MSGSQSLPSPPFVDIPGISNFRDIGGYETAQGKRIRRKLVYRSADPTPATEAGLNKLRSEIGLKQIFDLRSTPEISRSGPEWGGVPPNPTDIFEPYAISRSWTPVFADKDYGPEQVALRYKDYTRQGSGGFVKAYTDILKAGTGSYGRIFRYLAGATAGAGATEGAGGGLPQPCLVHCTAGKDRTGVLVALIFELCGVDREKIAEEYALTDLGLADKKPLFMERLLKNPVLAGDEEGVRNMVSSKKENMLATLDMIQSEFGGAEEYMRKKCGLTDEEIGNLRKNMLES